MFVNWSNAILYMFVCLYMTGSQKQLQKTVLYFGKCIFSLDVTTNTFIKIYIYIYVHSSSGRNSLKNWTILNQLTFTVLPSQLLVETNYLRAQMAESQTRLTCAFHVFIKIRVQVWNVMSILKWIATFQRAKLHLKMGLPTRATSSE